MLSNSAVKVLKQVKCIDYTWNVRRFIPYCSLPTGVSDQTGKKQIPTRVDGQSVVCKYLTRKGLLLPF